MRVVLLQDVDAVGIAGEICDVRDDVARERLFPERLAVAATPEAIREAAAARAAARAVSERELHTLERLAESVDGYECVVPAEIAERARVGEGVTAPDIAQLLREAGFDIADAWVALEHPITDAGTTPVRLEFPHGLEAEVMVLVENQESWGRSHHS